MRNVLVMMFVLLLVGCATTEGPTPPTCTDKLIWKAPEFEMPLRPIMRSETPAKTLGETVRNAELDMTDLTTYAAQLENILSRFKK